MATPATGPQPSSTSRALRELVDRARGLGREPRRYAAGEPIIGEGEANRALFILLEGEVALSKTGPDGRSLTLDRLGPGSLLGILSFWTGKPSFSDSHAATAVECLVIDQEQFDEGVAGDPEFAQVTQQLLVANLGDRYRRVVGLNLKVAGLTRDLERERNALREAVEDLQQTRNQLVHKEKLATMGQLLAGIAHEINNPSSSLLKNVDMLRRELPALFGEGTRGREAFEAGRRSSFVPPAETRQRMERLRRAFPSLPRSECRRLSRLDPEVWNLVREDVEGGRREAVDAVVRAHEIGRALRSIHVADERITRLVKSLKSYSRQDEEASSDVEVEQCIRDTLMVLNHRMKHFEVVLDLPDLPPIPGRAGEINQILTNLLTNACDATPRGRRIQLSAEVKGDRVCVEVADEGHGIPEDLIDKIFEPNVTTKSGGGQYGLGLGLAISRDLALQHRGNLSARNAPGGGAVFRLELPRGSGGQTSGSEG